MTSHLLEILARIHPILGNLSGIPLLVFIVVIVLTAIFLVGYLTQVEYSPPEIPERPTWRLPRAPTIQVIAKLPFVAET